MNAIETHGSTAAAHSPIGIEAAVCADIARRQALGIAKYGGTTVADNPLALRAWLQHGYEELLDAAVYMRRAIAEIDAEAGAEQWAVLADFAPGCVIYVAGPMTGFPGNNYAAFNAKAAELRAMGFIVENPAENPHPLSADGLRLPVCSSWQGYMRLALRQISRADAVYLLPGWRQSRGARVEHQLAVGMGMTLIGARA